MEKCVLGLRRVCSTRESKLRRVPYLGSLKACLLKAQSLRHHAFPYDPYDFLTLYHFSGAHRSE